MPLEMERALKRRALKMFGSATSERAKKYIYGTLRKTGWKPKQQRKQGGSLKNILTGR